MEPFTSAATILEDNFGRRVRYLRVSITDRCDFRCVYCMSDDMEFVPRHQVLTLEEVSLVCQAFVELGVDKIRITGGEPLVRKGVLGLLGNIRALDGLRELVITTNGSQLAQMAPGLKAAGVNRINVSLDSLRPDRFRRMTRVGDLDRVLQGVDAALAQEFDRIKLNAVVMRDYNHDEIVDLVSFAVSKGIDISFIEEMPLGRIDDHERSKVFYSSDEIRRDIEEKFALLPCAESTGGPSRYYRVTGTASRVGFISPHSHNFCGTCNRVRVTAEGRLLLCLGNEHSVDLRAVLRSGSGTRASETLKSAIVRSMALKPERHHFDLEAQPIIMRHMNVSGG